ncbi:LemA family protein [Vibrio coralliilyticus]|uniref:LemA family protein n=1 Tax=Vibrio coralliilyticus TaxID=190893 RepID=A0AAP6ZVP5_9VIBR|nr:LemA family protein [Vibrio coralliilyticus]NOI31801.1 LemA family protein [Vibrio coralliilyticus]NOJ25244.1 LemA family protein [Vibrio coralliilyticus]
MTTILVILAVVALFVIIINNSIIQRFNRVKQSWEDVLVSERQKLRILPRLDNLLKEHKTFEEAILKDVTKLRSAINKLNDAKEFDTESLADVQAASKRLAGGINATFEAYPELKSSQLFSQVMSEITEQEENVGASIRIFNSNVQAHNTGIEVFPNNLVNQVITRKERINGFTDTDASKEIEYTPNI